MLWLWLGAGFFAVGWLLPLLWFVFWFDRRSLAEMDRALDLLFASYK